MEATAHARFVRMSARKIRRVAELVRGKPVNEAIEILNFVPKAASVPLQKSIKSAAANVLAEEGTVKVHPEDLRIKRLFIDGGPILKRFRAVGMGRAYRIRKRTCHITVVVEGQLHKEVGRAASSLKENPVKAARTEKQVKDEKVEAVPAKPARAEKKTRTAKGSKRVGE
jgi:large subunit ribosomal protein L22